MKYFIFNEIQIVLGENSEENWELIEKFKNKNVYWLHLNSFSSGHVIILTNNISDSLLKYCGNICRRYSKYKNLKNIKICYTHISNIKKGKDKGEVMFNSNRKVKTYLI